MTKKIIRKFGYDFFGLSPKPKANAPPMIISGVDLSNIFGGQTKILGGKRWQKVIKFMHVRFSTIRGHVPGLPPKSTPMPMIDRYLVLIQTDHRQHDDAASRSITNGRPQVIYSTSGY